MLPESNQNQLRFNLNIPYSINKLSVRHRLPQPITIEKIHGKTTVAQQAESELTGNISALSVERLKHAQFLAQRQLKKIKDASALSGQTVEPARSHAQVIQSPPKANPSKPAQDQDGLMKKTSRTEVKVSASHKPSKVTPKKGTAQSLPAAGNSPPVKDVATQRSRPSAVGDAKRNLVQEMASVAPESIKTNLKNMPDTGTCSERSQLRQQSTSGIVQERLAGLATGSVPDLHKMAMERLIRVKEFDLFPSSKSLTSKKKSRLQKNSRVKKTNRPIRSPVIRVRSARDRIHPRNTKKIPLAHSRPVTALTRPTNAMDRQSTTRSYHSGHSVLHQPFNDHYSRLSRSLEGLQETKAAFPDPEHILHRMMASRSHRDIADRFRNDPKAIVDEIERDAKERLEPLLRRAETISQSLATEAWCRATAPHPTDRRTQPAFNRATSYSDSAESGDDARVSRGGDTARRRSPSPTAQDGESAGVDREDIPVQDLDTLKSMLSRLDEMEKEHIAIRHRWLTAADYTDEMPPAGADDDQVRVKVPDFTNFVEPRAEPSSAPLPMVYTKPKTAPVKPKPSLVSAEANKNANNMNVQPFRLLLSEDRTSSIMEGQKRYERFLDGIGHMVTGDFDPWNLAEGIADLMVDDCIDQVSDSFLQAGDAIVDTLYAEEFVKPSAGNIQSASS